MLVLMPSWYAERVTLLPLEDLISNSSRAKTLNDMVYSRAGLLDLE